MQRDLYIDFAKGLATLSVIFIHTVFWSGQFYVPTELRVMSLLFDVPVFFLLSGYTSSGKLEKTLYRLLKLQITYMIFVTGVFFLDSLFKIVGSSIGGEAFLQDFFGTFGGKYAQSSGAFHWETLGNWWLHSYRNADIFPVVMGSFWYLKVYFILTAFGALILRFFPRHINWFIALCLALTLIFNFYSYPTGQVGYIAIYLAVFLAGHQLSGKKIKAKVVPLLYLMLGGFVAWMFYYFGPDIFYKINKQKFPPRIPYIVWMLPALVTVAVLYKRLKIKNGNLVTYIGQNAIFYYFAQGVSSSLIYFMVVPLSERMHWVALLILAYVINVLLAIGIAEVAKKADNLGWKILEYLRSVTANKTARD